MLTGRLSVGAVLRQIAEPQLPLAGIHLDHQQRRISRRARRRRDTAVRPVKQRLSGGINARKGSPIQHYLGELLRIRDAHHRPLLSHIQL